MNYIFVRKLDNKIFNCEATWHFIYMRQFNDHFMWRLIGIYHASKVLTHSRVKKVEVFLHKICIDDGVFMSFW